MTTIDISELEQHPAEVMRRVKSGETIEISEDGAAVARLMPVMSAMPVWNSDQTWTDLDALVEEISKYLPERVDVVEAVREIRREL